MASPKKPVKEFSSDFMLKEYERLYSLRASEDRQSEQRVNFFITLATAAVAALLVFFQIAKTSGTIRYFVTLGVLITLLLFGIETMNRLATKTVQQAVYDKVLSEIRAYFGKHDPEIAAYVSFYKEVSRPKQSRLLREVTRRFQGSLIDLVILSNSLACGGIVLTISANTAITVEAIISCTAVTVLLAMLLFDGYYQLLKKIIYPFRF